jgi:hypothetical protein
MSKKTVKEKAKCPICLDHFTSIIRQPIICSYCPHTTCRQCTSQFLLSSLNEPHCMHCKREWNREFIDTKLTQTFRKGPLKLHRRRVLMDRERGRLPAMQVFVQAHMTIQNASIRLYTLKKERKALKEQRNKIQVEYTSGGFEELTDRLKPIVTELATKKLEIRKLEKDIMNSRLILLGQEKPEMRQQFIMKCPAEECRGFLSSAWKCGTCDKFFCSDCHAIKSSMRDEQHVCNEDAKATAVMIRQETKPCPKCGIRISKIDGCDQMWCIECHTTFSWNTGQILLNTVVHNPHYYEYLRKTNGGNIPRELGDIPCGGLPNAYQFTRAVFDCPNVSVPIKQKLTDALRGINDIHYARLPGFPLRPNANINRDIDIEYLMQKISEEEWGTKLEQAETRFERKKEIGLVLQTLVHIASEKLTAVMNARPEEKKKVYEKTVEEMENVRKYVNDALMQKGIQMGIVVPQIGNTFHFMWAKKEDIKAEKGKKAVNTIVMPGQEDHKEEEKKEDDGINIEEEKHDREEDDETVMVEIDGEMIVIPRNRVKEMMAP